MDNKLAILGAGGHGKVVADAALVSGEWSSVVFFDDVFPDKSRNGDWPIVGSGNDLLQDHKKFDGIIVAIGENRVRLDKIVELQRIGAKIVSILHPRAIISPFATIAPGCAVFAGAIINVGAKISLACIINSGAVIEHDCLLHDGVHVSPNASLAGKTKIGECSWIGIGAVTRQLVTIGSDVVVGAGSVVLNSVPDGVTVIGNPATLK